MVIGIAGTEGPFLKRRVIDASRKIPSSSAGGSFSGENVTGNAVYIRSHHSGVIVVPEQSREVDGPSLQIRHTADPNVAIVIVRQPDKDVIGLAFFKIAVD